jgi:prolyl oligopeptidase
MRIESVPLSVAVLWLFLPSGCSTGAPPPPESKRVDVVDTIHGVSLTDPYRWLEDQGSPETRAWIDAQNAYAERIVGESPTRERLRARLRELLEAPEASFPSRAGAYEYFALRRSRDDLPILYRRAATPEGEVPPDPRATLPPGATSGDELVLDPHPLSPDHTTRVEMLSISPDGNLLLYGLRDGGEDEIEVRVRNVAEGADLPDRLPRALYDGVSFGRKGRGFYYTLRSRETGPRARFHEIGKPVAEDVTLFGEGYGPTCFIEASEIGDGRYLLFTVNHGWARSEVHIQDLARNGPPRALFTGVDARFDPELHDGVLYLRTNLDAPNNRLVAVDLERLPAGPPEIRGILTEKEDVLSGFTILDGKIYASYLHDVSSRILVFSLDGAPAGEIPLPPLTTAELRGAAPGKAFLTLASFTLPPTTYVLDLASGEKRPWSGDAGAVPFDPAGLRVEQVHYRSLDGTEVPMFLFHREGIETNGDNPTLLFGYGGFNVAMTPFFDPMAAVWVERGGVFAMANLRGGSELGEKWHRAGMLQNKQNVFDDFIAAAEFLIAKGYTRPERLAIRGVSNGGLLVASALTERPDLFRAVVCGFPDLDMIRFYTFRATNNLPALLEYGDASIPEQFEFLRKYSPYQAVRDDTNYPAVMLTSGDLDTRVPPLQARRMTARLQAATTSGLPVILRYHPKAGHAANYGMPVSRTVENLAMELAFLSQQLGTE